MNLGGLDRAAGRSRYSLFSTPNSHYFSLNIRVAGPRDREPDARAPYRPRLGDYWSRLGDLGTIARVTVVARGRTGSATT